MPDKVVFVGHSQGGHAVLAAQSYAASYGMHGTLAGVAAYAPMWFSMSAWGAATTPTAGFTTATDPSFVLYTMEYDYSAGALRGDANGGLDVFQAAKQQAAKDVLLGGDCYDNAKLVALGARPADFFDMDFVNNVGFNCAANPIQPDCTMAPSTPAGDAPLWLSRWQEDRPALDPNGAPILIWNGGMDTFVTPGRAECAREKLNNDLMATAGATTTVKLLLRRERRPPQYRPHRRRRLRQSVDRGARRRRRGAGRVPRLPDGPDVPDAPARPVAREHVANAALGAMLVT